MRLTGHKERLAVPVANLPTPPTPFIGRAEELTEIARLLADPACRLLTLVGPGGMGKTRLAIEVAGRLAAPAFANGVCFVDLQPVTTGDVLVTTLVSVLGLLLTGSQDPRAQLLHYLSTHNMLLLLDNFEQLLNDVDLLVDILKGASGIKLLVTSREALNLQEEWVWQVGGLHVPSDQPGIRIETYSAVQLFVACACRARHDFTLTGQEAHITRICEMVEGMPLALELAASWTSVLSCAEIADEIQHSLDFLTTNLRNVPQRHRSMQAVFDHSWRLLTEEEQSVFRRMSVFRGGFTRHAAERVAGASLWILSALVAKSRLSAAPDGRYSLHELLRQYAEQQLQAVDGWDAAHDSHSAYYLDFLAQREADVKGRRQQAALHEIRAEFENIWAGWLWAVEHRNYEVISRALDCLVIVAEMNYSLLKAQNLLRQTAIAWMPASGQVSQPVWQQIVVRRERINLLTAIRADQPLLETILEQARERGDHHEVAWCLWVLGDHAYVIGDLATFRARFEESLALWQIVGDDYFTAHVLVGLHSVYRLLGQPDRALESLRESIALRRRLHDQSSLCYSLGVLSLRLMHDGAFAQAEKCANEALTIQEQIGKTPFFPALIAAKALLAFWRGKLETAAQQAHAGLDFARDRNYLDFRNLCLAVLSFGASISGDYKQAHELCEQAAADLLNPMIALFLDWGLALASCGLNNDKIARRILLTCLRTAGFNEKSPTFQRLCLPLAAVLAARAGDPQRAVNLLGLFFTSPPDLTGWLDQWPLMLDLAAKLKAEMGSEAHTTAWEHGKTLDLDAVIQELLEVFRLDDEVTRAFPTHVIPVNARLPEPLTKRELEVLQLMAAGMSNHEIARRLFIGISTVKKHINHIFGKLSVEDRQQAVTRAHTLRLL